MKKAKSWVEKKLESTKIRKMANDEYEKLCIAEQLIKIRHEAGLTQSEVAKKVGTTASAISRYENIEYDRYELNTIRKIVEACGGMLKISIIAKT